MTKISELPDGIACDPTDQVAVVQSGTTIWHDTISGVKSAFPKGE